MLWLPPIRITSHNATIGDFCKQWRKKIIPKRSLNVQRHEKTCFLHMSKQRHRSTSLIVQFLYFLNPNFQAPSHLWLYSLPGLCQKPERDFFFMTQLKSLLISGPLKPTSRRSASVDKDFVNSFKSISLSCKNSTLTKLSRLVRFCYYYVILQTQTSTSHLTTVDM